MLPETRVRFIPTVTVILVSLLAGALFVLGGFTVFTKIAKSGSNTVQNAVPTSVSISQLNKLPDLAGMVKSVSPAIVNIETIIQNSNQKHPYFSNPYYQEFFGHSIPFDTGVQQSSGAGSGFIINKEGYIVTNDHVISGAAEINVKVAGFEKSFKATVIGSDPELDLAVIKIEADKDLPSLQMGDSDNVNVGDWAVAIGNPYGLDNTVTLGVVSAKGRPVIVGSQEFKNLLQTDAAINPGNSGGPLLNLNGEVVGINTAVNAEGQGIGFAIPTATVEAVLNDLMEDAVLVGDEVIGKIGYGSSH